MTININIIECFDKLILKTSNDMKINKDTKLKFKIITYKKIIEIIKNIDFQITNIEQIKHIKGIGKSTLDKVNEILNTGTLDVIKSFNSNICDNSKKINELQRITGIGPIKAQKLVDIDISLNSLINIDFNNLTNTDIILLDTLTHHQKLGIKYFNDLEHKIPHGEIIEIELYIKKLIKKSLHGLNIIICGSFRRQKEVSGDIDILLYHDNNEIKENNYLQQFIRLLILNNFITDNLTSINSTTKYMGFCKYDIFNRRIDVRLIHKQSISSAMLYFTGCGEFNKSMRIYALKKGFTINEYGIYKLKSNGTKGLKLKTNKEEDIFKLLNLPYIEPINRISTYEFK